jgi:hypothetical protein
MLIPSLNKTVTHQLNLHLAAKATQPFVLLYIFINQNKRLKKPIVLKTLLPYYSYALACVM